MRRSSTSDREPSKSADKAEAMNEPVQGERIPQTMNWWKVVRKVGILMAFVYGSKFVGKIIKHRGFSFLTLSEGNVG